MGNFMIGLWVVYAILGWLLFHKVFTVYYTSASYGIIKEIVGAAFFGFIMTFLTLKFWLISAIIILIIGLVLLARAKTTEGRIGVAVAFVILAAVIVIVGRDVESTMSESESAQTSFAEGCNHAEILYF